MGVAFYPVFEGGTGRWPDAINGKILARAANLLDKVAKRAKVKTLYDFFSMTRNQSILELMNGDPEDPSTFDEAKVPAEVWHDPREGLRTVEVLIEHCRQNGATVSEAELLMSDLVAFEQALSDAAARNVRWHLVIDT